MLREPRVERPGEVVLVGRLRCATSRRRCKRGRLRFATHPLLTAFGRTPAANAATPGGGLLSSAFLAVVVRVHSQGDLGQQKANPNVSLGSVTNPRRGLRR